MGEDEVVWLEWERTRVFYLIWGRNALLLPVGVTEKPRVPI